MRAAPDRSTLRFLTTAALACLLAALPGAARAGRIRAQGYIVAGQSQAAQISPLPDPLPAAPDTQVWIASRGPDWYPLQGPVWGVDNGRSSQWAHFGRAYRARFPKRPLRLMVTVQGNTCLAAHPVSRPWEPRWDPDRGDLYAAMVASVAQSRFSGVLRGVIWHQGECEVTERTSGAVYEAALLHFADRVWEDLGVPVYAAPVWTADGHAARLAIREAIERAVEEHPHLHLGPEVNDLTLWDGSHYLEVDVLGARWVNDVLARRSCGLGFEIALLAPLLGYLARRRAPR